MEQYKKIIFGILILNGLIVIDSFLLPPVERNEFFPVALCAEKREVYLWMAAFFSAMCLAFDFW